VDFICGPAAGAGRNITVVNPVPRRSWMTGAQRIESLRAKHSRLEIEIDQEAHRPLPDTVQLAALKREKLRIKEQILRMQRPH
jgi:hypothetical protein